MKNLLITSHYLGATKQVPYLAREILRFRPDVNIYASLSDFHGNCNNKEILKNDIEKLDAEMLNNIHFSHPRQYDLEVYLDSSRSWRTRIGKCMYLFVEPLKFEERPQLNESEQEELKKRYHLQNKEVVLGGALFPHEVLPFCNAVLSTNKHGVIVPRGICDAVARILDDAAIQYALNERNKDAQFTLITAGGILQDLYAICDTAVIGNSLWTAGKGGEGQNPLEPAFYGKRIIAGDRWKNNRTAFKGLRRSGLLTEVGNQEELNREIARYISADEITTYQEKARKFITKHQGAAQKYAKKIVRALR